MERKWRVGVFMFCLVGMCVMLSRPVEAARMSKTEVTVYAGNSETLRVSGTSKKVLWSSADRNIAAVNSRGKVLGLKRGRTQILANVGNHVYVCSVTVQNPYLCGMSKMRVSESAPMRLVKGHAVSYHSSSPNIATINSTGRIYAKQIGKTNITIQDQSGHFYKTTIEVLRQISNCNHIWKQKQVGKYYCTRCYQTRSLRNVKTTITTRDPAVHFKGLAPEKITRILSKISNDRAKKAVSYALRKVGYPYSQEYRDSGSYYDCSSLVYYAWKDAGTNIAYQGMNSAAAEAQGLTERGKRISLSGLKPGDLVFYSYTQNGRYMNISHVAMYVGDGMLVEARNQQKGVVYNAIHSQSYIVAVCRP